MGPREHVVSDPSRLYHRELPGGGYVTIELVRRGYSEEQIGKLWSGNLLRVMAEVEKVAGREQGRAGQRR